MGRLHFAITICWLCIVLLIIHLFATNNWTQNIELNSEIFYLLFEYILAIN